NEQVIGDDIRNRTAEEMNLGKCPVCGGTLAIKHMRGNSQFIGCSRYPDCTFNIGLPMTQWGFAVRTDDVCEKHGLNFVRLIRKGARPWDIGCPLCHHINSNQESLAEIAGMTPALIETIQKRHVYSVAELSRSVPDQLAKKLDISTDAAVKIISGAGTVLEKLRRRTECRKFLRDRLIPRKGRSYSKIQGALRESGIMELADLARTDAAILKKAGISEQEAELLLSDAKAVYNSQVLKKIGIPAVSLKKYINAGIITPEAFCDHTPAALSELTGMSLSTVQKHVTKVCASLNRPTPKKVSTLAIERGKKQLLAVRGLTVPMLEALLRAGITDAESLRVADAKVVAGKSGIDEQKIAMFKKILQKKKDNAIIQI
ncbi:MAG: DNA topoisomerase I, partial [Methanomicrobiales archaeon]|nr:DNA topoisomerase I [Methanomicrobiales archaeon]